MLKNIQVKCYLTHTSECECAHTSVQSGARHGLCLVKQGDDWSQPGDKPVRSQDPRECCQRCRADSSCTRFTYNNLGCFLQPSAASPSRNPDACSGTSSVKIPTVAFSPACLVGMGCNNTDGFAEAAAAAASADATVVVLGLDQASLPESGWMESEG